MNVLIGLGNPGKKYSLSRHNMGFLVVDFLISKWGAKGVQKKFQAEVFESQGKTILLKPQTFMNLSGQSVQKVVSFWKLSPSQCFIFHDELDLPFGVFRIKKGGGLAGHRGLASIAQCLGNDFLNKVVRLRIGIGRAPSPLWKTSDWVLSKFSKREQEKIPVLMEEIFEAIEMILKGDLQKAMTRFHQKKEKE